MMRALFLSLTFVFVLPLAAHAEVSAADKAAVDAKVNAFFDSVNAGKTEQAMNTVFLPRMTDKKLELQNLTGQFEMAVKYAGAPVKWSEMTQSELADRLIYRKYLVYSDDMPFRVTFVFFKTSKGWFAQTMNFSDLSVSDFEN